MTLALLAMIRKDKQYLPDLPPEQTVTILLDNGYHKEHSEQAMERIEEPLREQIRIEIPAKSTPEQKTESKKACPEKNGFAAVKKRWIVERTECAAQSVPRCCGRIAKGGGEPSEAKIGMCAIRLILRRIA